MANKTITFDASEVITTTGTANYMTVTIETDYLDEVLNEFSADEILNNYGNIDTLYDTLKEYFGDKD